MAPKLSKKKKLAISIAIPIVAIIVIVLLLANTPMHRFNNYHVDEEGDVSDRDIDILWVKSSDYDDYVLLEMKVAGKIRNTFTYDISVVANDLKNEHKEGFIYRCTYFNESVEQYNFFGRVVNEDALQILFPKSYFDEGFYMIGLEGCTRGDFCREGMERHNDIRKWLPIF